MTPEEMQRTIEFIGGQQAKFESDIRKLFESDERQRASQATLTVALARLTEIIGENQKANHKRFAQLVEADKATMRRIAALADAQKAADERLEMFINVVERHLFRRRNGKKRRKQ
jgi:hypothetical protein